MLLADQARRRPVQWYPRPQRDQGLSRRAGRMLPDSDEQAPAEMWPDASQRRDSWEYARPIAHSSHRGRPRRGVDRPRFLVGLPRDVACFVAHAVSISVAPLSRARCRSTSVTCSEGRRSRGCVLDGPAPTRGGRYLCPRSPRCELSNHLLASSTRAVPASGASFFVLWCRQQ